MENRLKEAKQFHLQVLFENIQLLTKPHTTTLEIDDINGNTTKTKIQTDSLIEQLENAVQSTQIYGSNRGTTQANTRSVLDLSAIILLQQIKDELDQLRLQIQDTSKRHPDLSDAIRQYYTHLQLATEHNPLIKLSPIVKITTSWVNTINLKFDPPVVLDITKPCPKCNNEYVFDDYDDRHRAVVIAWRKTFEKSRAECRACGQTWVGESELRQLRWTMDQENDTPTTN